MKKLSLLFIGCLFIISCGAVTPEDYNYAEKVCENNGGVDYLYLDFGEFRIYCNNGARFYKDEFIYSDYDWGKDD